ncbi:hypothetical protein RUND412_010251 [Rhizina undulata]
MSLHSLLTKGTASVPSTSAAEQLAVFTRELAKLTGNIKGFDQLTETITMDDRIYITSWLLDEQKFIRDAPSKFASNTASVNLADVMTKLGWEGESIFIASGALTDARNDLLGLWDRIGSDFSLLWTFQMTKVQREALILHALLETEKLGDNAEIRKRVIDFEFNRFLDPVGTMFIDFIKGLISEANCNLGTPSASQKMLEIFNKWENEEVAQGVISQGAFEYLKKKCVFERALCSVAFAVTTLRLWERTLHPGTEETSVLSINKHEEDHDTDGITPLTEDAPDMNADSPKANNQLQQNNPKKKSKKKGKGKASSEKCKSRRKAKRAQQFKHEAYIFSTESIPSSPPTENFPLRTNFSDLRALEQESEPPEPELLDEALQRGIDTAFVNGETIRLIEAGNFIFHGSDDEAHPEPTANNTEQDILNGTKDKYAPSESNFGDSIVSGLPINPTSDDIRNFNLLLDLEHSDNLMLNDFEALNEYRQQWITSELSTFRTKFKLKIDEAKVNACREQFARKFRELAQGITIDVLCEKLEEVVFETSRGNFREADHEIQGHNETLEEVGVLVNGIEALKEQFQAIEKAQSARNTENSERELNAKLVMETILEKFHRHLFQPETSELDINLKLAQLQIAIEHLNCLKEEAVETLSASLANTIPGGNPELNETAEEATAVLDSSLTNNIAEKKDAVEANDTTDYNPALANTHILFDQLAKNTCLNCQENAENSDFTNENSNTVQERELKSSTNSNVEGSGIQVSINVESEILEPQLTVELLSIDEHDEGSDQYFTAEEGSGLISPDCISTNMTSDLQVSSLAPPASIRRRRIRGKYVAIPLNMFTKPARKQERITFDELLIPVVSALTPYVDEQTAKDSTLEFFTEGNPADPDISIELPEHASEVENANIDGSEESSDNPEAVEVLVNESNILTHETLENTPEIPTDEGLEVFPLASPNNGETFEDRVRDLIQRSSSQSSGTQSPPSEQTSSLTTRVEHEFSNTEGQEEFSLLRITDSSQSFVERVAQVIRASFSPPSEVQSPPAPHSENTALEPIPVDYIQFHCATCTNPLFHAYSKVCPGCGPNSDIRYCSRHCQFSDIDHWKICRRSPLKIPSTALAIQHVFELQPLDPESINPALFAQSLYMYNDPEVDYFLLSKPTPTTVADVIYPVQMTPDFRPRFRMLRYHAFRTREYGAVRMMFRYILAHLPGGSSIETAFGLAAQMESEFGHDVSGCIGMMMPEEWEWAGMEEYLRSLEAAEGYSGVEACGV